MAKTQVVDKKAAYPHESYYGSHKSMVIKTLDNNQVICKDEFGEYQTTTDRLDDGTADPSRFDFKHRKVFL